LSFHHQLLRIVSPFDQGIRLIGKSLGVSFKSQLRVLAYHDIPPNQEKYFLEQIYWLRKNWNIISPSEFELMLSGVVPIIGNNLLITFDDGFKSNRVIAERVLNPLNIKAIFFVISDFVGLDNDAEAKDFIAKRIMPGNQADDIPENITNMQWSDLEELLEAGHTIGCHTKTHERLSNNLSASELAKEIVFSAEKINQKLGIEVNNFAYTYGDIHSFNQEALNIAMNNFDFVFSGIRGNNAYDVSQFTIRREASAYQTSTNEYKIFRNEVLGMLLKGVFDFRYSKARQTIDLWRSQL